MYQERGIDTFNVINPCVNIRIIGCYFLYVSLAYKSHSRKIEIVVIFIFEVEFGYWIEKEPRSSLLYLHTHRFRN